MPKVKVPRKSTYVDMTAMTDVAFLLLTFFMLATKFKPDEPVIVDTPSSTSKVIMPEKAYILISLDKNGRVFYGIENELLRKDVLREIGDVFDVKFSERELDEFAQMPSIGMPVAELKSYLSMDPEKRKSIKQTGIPCDSTENELKDWVYQTLRFDNTVKVVIKGDKDSEYPMFDEVMKTLKKFRLPQYSFITSLENGE